MKWTILVAEASRPGGEVAKVYYGMVNGKGVSPPAAEKMYSEVTTALVKQSLTHRTKW